LIELGGLVEVAEAGLAAALKIGIWYWGTRGTWQLGFFAAAAAAAGAAGAAAGVTLFSFCGSWVAEAGGGGRKYSCFARHKIDGHTDAATSVELT
jgi:hypothetical protein